MSFYLNVSKVSKVDSALIQLAIILQFNRSSFFPYFSLFLCSKNRDMHDFRGILSPLKREQWPEVVPLVELLSRCLWVQEIRSLATDTSWQWFRPVQTIYCTEGKKVPILNFLYFYIQVLFKLIITFHCSFMDKICLVNHYDVLSS